MGESESKTRSLGERLNTWVQITGILIAACWGVYTFYHEKIKVPKMAPINISVNLSLKKIATGGPNKSFAAVEMKAAAVNPSSREIQLFPSAWIAYGVNVKDHKSFSNYSAHVLSVTNRIMTVQRHSFVRSSKVVAFGHLFRDTTLKPSERSERTLTIYVPEAEYDALEVLATMPSAANANGLQLEWRVNGDGALEPTMYRIGKKGEREPMKEDATGSYVDKGRELQMAGSHTEICLWPDLPR